MAALPNSGSAADWIALRAPTHPHGGFVGFHPAGDLVRATAIDQYDDAFGSLSLKSGIGSTPGMDESCKATDVSTDSHVIGPAASQQSPMNLTFPRPS